MDTTKLFEAALGIVPPWRVAGIEFKAGAQAGRGRLEIRLDFARGGELPCPECGNTPRSLAGAFVGIDCCGQRPRAETPSWPARVRWGARPPRRRPSESDRA